MRVTSGEFTCQQATWYHVKDNEKERESHMQIQISENLFTRLQHLALRRQQPVEKIISERLFTSVDDELDKLPFAEQAELRALHHLSNDALRTIAAEQMRTDNQLLLTQLMEQHSRGLLLQDKQETLKELVTRGDQLMLRKAEAAAILVHRNANKPIANLMNMYSTQSAKQV